MGCHHGTDPAAWYRDAHRIIAAAISRLDLKGVKPDVVAVADHLGSRNELESCGGSMYLAQLMNEMRGSYDNLPVYQRIVKNAWIARKALIHSNSLISEIYNRNGREYHDIIADHSARLLDICDGSEEGRKEVTAAESCKAFIADLEDRMDGKRCVGYETGWSEYDRLTGGLTPGELVIMAGRPSMGKSAIAVNWISNLCRKGVSSLLFSLESKHGKIMNRLVARHARVDSTALKLGRLNPSEIERVYSATPRIAEFPLTVIDCPSTDIDIVIKSKRLRKQIVWVDYLGLVTPAERNKRREVELAGITRRLKLLAMEMEIPVVLLCQLNREIEKENRDPKLSDLRESGAIEQDADVVLFVHVDRKLDRNADHGARHRKIILDKQREGALGSWLMEFQGEYQFFQRYGAD